MTYYSQYEQDKLIYEVILKKPVAGFVLDIGAMCGVRISNSKFFEDIGWNGLLVEANPKQLEKLAKNRKWDRVEKAVVPNNFVDDQVEFLAFDIDQWGEGLSGILQNYDLQHRKRIAAEQAQGYIKRIPDPVQVPVIRMKDLLEKCPKVIDILSIDIEGGELNLLKSIDFMKYKIKVITVENNYNNPFYKTYLEGQNFTLYRKEDCDEIYVNNCL